MLTYYRTMTNNLLQSPAAPTTLYDSTSIDLWINTARAQVAGEGECIRVLGTLNTTIGQRNYNFSSINIGVVATTGAQGALHVRAIRYALASGYKWIRPRNWEWFDFYRLNNPAPVNGPPEVWSQYAQGGAGSGSITGIGTGTMDSGSFYLDPPPDIAYALTCDCVCYPQALSADTDVEAIPYMWGMAVPFLAAYYALMSAQTGARYGDAERLYSHFETFMDRARKAANSSVNRYLYQQSVDVTLLNKLGQMPKAASGG